MGFIWNVWNGVSPETEHLLQLWARNALSLPPFRVFSSVESWNRGWRVLTCEGKSDKRRLMTQLLCCRSPVVTVLANVVYICLYSRILLSFFEVLTNIASHELWGGIWIGFLQLLLRFGSVWAIAYSIHIYFTFSYCSWHEYWLHPAICKILRHKNPLNQSLCMHIAASSLQK